MGISSLARAALLRACRVPIRVPRVAAGVRSRIPRRRGAWSHKTNTLPPANVLCIIPSRAALARSAQPRKPATGRRLRGQREEGWVGHGPVLGSRVRLLGRDMGVTLGQRWVEMLEDNTAVC